MKKFRKGFTLIELLIVIAVLGALTAMMQLSGTNAAASAKAAAIVNSLQTVRTAVNMYIAENAGGTYAVDDFELSEYMDTSVIGDTSKYTFSAGTGDEAEHWFVAYEIPTANATAIKAKLAERATADKLLAAATETAGEGGFAEYADGTSVYMRVH